MPYKYVMESFCDMVGASMAYNPKDWKPSMLVNYWETKCKGKRIMNEQSQNLVELLIYSLEKIGLKNFFKWYKEAKKELKNQYGR